MLVCLLVWALPASAAQYCVSASNGNDATAKASIIYVAGNEAGSTCWASILRAARGSTTFDSPNAGEAAAAGDTVYVFPGAYTATGRNSRTTPAFNPVNSGTNGNPITFVSLGVETITFTSGTGPVIGAESVNYITWRGFSVDEALAPAASDTGPVVLWNCTGCIIEYCEIDGNDVEPGFGAGELHNGVRINGGADTTVRYNYIHGFRANNAGANGSAILVDQSDGGLIEYNTIYDSDGVFFIKRNYLVESTWTVRYNHAYSVVRGIRADQLTDTSTAETVDVYQNLLVDVTEACFVTWQYDGSDTTGLRFVNNTCVNGALAFESATLDASAGHKVYNNIFTSVPLGYRTADYAAAWTTTTIDAQHNVLEGMTNAATFRYELSGQSTVSFATWQGYGQDIDSSQSDPVFANAAGGDYRLCTAAGVPHASCSGASPAINLGVDIFDLDGDSSIVDSVNAGAYITGNETIGAGASSVSAPVRLRITGAPE